MPTDPRSHVSAISERIENRNRHSETVSRKVRRAPLSLLFPCVSTGVFACCDTLDNFSSLSSLQSPQRLECSPSAKEFPAVRFESGSPYPSVLQRQSTVGCPPIGINWTLVSYGQQTLKP